MPKSRVQGGEKNDKSGVKWTDEELKQVLDLYIQLKGKGLHETNPLIIDLGGRLGRTTRSVEAQLIMFRSLERGKDYGHVNMNKACEILWNDYVESICKPESKLQPNSSMAHLSKFFDWFGHRNGGVKIAFTDRGNPTGAVVKTDLILVLEKWVSDLMSGVEQIPRKLFFIGGPGNGKTQALDYVVTQILDALGVQETVFSILTNLSGNNERRLEVDISQYSQSFSKIVLVQDASVGDHSSRKNAAMSMLEDFQDFPDESLIYICCINRGVLQDVLDTSRQDDQRALRFFTFLSTHIDTSKQYIENTWPIAYHDDQKSYMVGIWPMEISSLFEEVTNQHTSPKISSPFMSVLGTALNDTCWGKVREDYVATKLNAAFCPLLSNHHSLASNNGAQLQKIISEFETVSNRRVTFREMLSLVAFLLVGHEDDFVNGQGKKSEPQTYVKELLADYLSNRENIVGYERLFKLAMFQWEFKIFNKWPDISLLIKDAAWKQFVVKQKQVGNLQASIAFQNIFTQNGHPVFRTDLEKTLSQACYLLDPSKLNDNIEECDGFNPGLIDLHLQVSIGSLRNNLGNSPALNTIDLSVLDFFIKVEKELDEIRTTENVNSIISVVERLTYILRKVCAAYVKRKIGAYFGISSESRSLESFAQIGNDKAIQNIVTGLLGIVRNNEWKGKNLGTINVDLNSTFGQPDYGYLAIYYRATVMYLVHIYTPQSVSNIQPLSKTKFIKLSVVDADDHEKTFVYPVSFHFYSTLIDISKGLKNGTLPRDITATFDRMKSFLEGVAVHSNANENFTIQFPSGAILNVNKTNRPT